MPGSRGNETPDARPAGPIVKGERGIRGCGLFTTTDFYAQPARDWRQARCTHGHCADAVSERGSRRVDLRSLGARRRQGDAACPLLKPRARP